MTHTRLTSLILLTLASCADASHPVDDLTQEVLARAPHGRSGSSCRAFDRGRLLSRKTLEGDAVTSSEARAKWDNWVAARTVGYLTDDYEPDLSGARAYDKRRIVYCTVDANGEPTKASALLTVPRGGGRFTTIVYHHGTAFTRVDAPSHPDETEVFDGPSVEITFSPFAILIAPDLSAFEESTLVRHQYLVAGEAEGSIDAVIAASQVPGDIGASNGKLVSFGFSAGSHAALAFSRHAQSLGVSVTGTVAIGTIAQPGGATTSGRGTQPGASTSSTLTFGDGLNSCASNARVGSLVPVRRNAGRANPSGTSGSIAYAEPSNTRSRHNADARKVTRKPCAGNLHARFERGSCRLRSSSSSEG